MDGERQLETKLAKLVKGIDCPRILDVGAGPISLLGRRIGETLADLVPVDPLAKGYTSILEKYRVEPPVRTEEASVEQLERHFGADTFDLVFMCNALDHSVDPVKGLSEMLAVARPNGYVFLQHYVNEGVEELYAGLHQWNLCCDQGSFIIWSPSERHNASELFGGLAEITVQDSDVGLQKRWLEVTMRKRC